MRILNPNLALSQASVDEVINVSQNSEQLVPDSPEEEGDKIDIPTDSEIARQRTPKGRCEWRQRKTPLHEVDGKKAGQQIESIILPLP